MPEQETVMVVDGGGRGHALSKRYEQSPNVRKVVVAPGNDFITHRREKDVVTGPCDLKSPGSILEAARRHKPDLVDVAQDDALAAGTVDLLRKHGFVTVGPTKAAAMIESSKVYSRDFQLWNGLPTPYYRTFEDPGEAKEYAAQRYTENPDARLFTKADGLQAGKGALASDNRYEAAANIEAMAEMGERRFLIEDGYEGEEFSWTSLTDGESVLSFRSSQDNKRLRDGDEGPQTGGMGVIAPTLVTEGHERHIEQEIMQRTVDGLREEGRRFEGFLYLNAMVLDRSGFGVIEFNARIGDPEAQALLDGLPDDLDYLDLMKRVHDGELDGADFRQDDLCRAYVVCSAPGYPGKHRTGMRISGLDRVMDMPDVDVLGSAVSIDADGTQRADGGRLFGVLGRGPDTLSALERAYEAIKHVDVDGGFHYRRDIGWRDAERLKRAA